jgi:hypothetical protein
VTTHKPTKASRRDPVAFVFRFDVHAKAGSIPECHREVILTEDLIGPRSKFEAYAEHMAKDRIRRRYAAEGFPRPKIEHLSTMYLYTAV